MKVLLKMIPLSVLTDNQEMKERLQGAGLTRVIR